MDPFALLLSFYRHQQLGLWGELEDWSYQLGWWGKTIKGAWVSFDHGAATPALDHLKQERCKLLSDLSHCCSGLKILTDTHFSQGLVQGQEITRKESRMLPGANSTGILLKEKIFKARIFFNYHCGSAPLLVWSSQNSNQVILMLTILFKAAHCHLTPE